MAEIADFVLDFCRTYGGVVEPPHYGVYDLLLPDAVAAQLGVEPYQRFAFDEERAAPDVVALTYGHPLVERMAELVRQQPAGTQLYIDDLRLEKSGLAALARESWLLPNATVAEIPKRGEETLLSHSVRFNFKAALISDEKREQIVSVLVDAQAGAVVPEWPANASFRLVETPTWEHLAVAPAWWTSTDDWNAHQIDLDALHTLLERASQGAADQLGPTISAMQKRAERLLELDRARLEAYFADLEKDLARRLQRAEDESRRAGIESKLAATRADHAAKLADAEAKYQLRLELELINLALIVQPKLVVPVQIQNRNNGVTRSAIWDPVRRQIEPLVCEVCMKAQPRIFLCANDHLACADCLAPQCVDCKRVYCQKCAGEVLACSVCQRPVCRRSAVHCASCDQITCHEHTGQCHAPVAAAPAPSAAPPVVEEKPPTPASKTVQAPPKAPSVKSTKQKTTPPVAVNYRLQVEVRPDDLIIAFVLNPDDREIAKRMWKLIDEGIAVRCICEKGYLCPSASKVVRPEAPNRLLSQLESAIAQLRNEYHVPPFRMAIYDCTGPLMQRLPKLHLTGKWQSKSAIATARAGWEKRFGAG